MPIRQCRLPRAVGFPEQMRLSFASLGLVFCLQVKGDSMVSWTSSPFQPVTSLVAGLTRGMLPL